MMAAVWIPAHYINFWFVLLHLRMPVMNFFGVFLARSVSISRLHSPPTSLVTLAPSPPPSLTVPPCIPNGRLMAMHCRDFLFLPCPRIVFLFVSK